MLMKLTFESVDMKMKSGEHFLIEKCSDNNVCGNYMLPEKSLAGQYFAWIGRRDPYVVDVEKVSVVKDANYEIPPFLSIVTRTQGRRFEEITETLLCLAGQSDVDFEIIIVGHNLDEAGKASTTQAIEEMPCWLQSKTRFALVQGGNRTRPLNVAFSLAKGSYITILDDDDIVFDNWVSSFKGLARENWGSLLHCFVFSQQWRVQTDENGTRSLRALEAPVPTFCEGFDIFEQFTTNHCPTMSLAFPSYIFQGLGFYFDESLTTTEDWDFLMQAFFVGGMAVSEEPVAIYRLWENSESSSTAHSKKEWDTNRWAIQDKFYDMPILLPIHSSERFVNRGDEHSSFLPISPKDIKLYLDNGSGYSEAMVIKPQLREGSSNIFIFEDLKKYGLLSAIRIDPRRDGFATVKNLCIEVSSITGEKVIFHTKNVLHNGFCVDEQTLVFLKDDPQVVVEFSPSREIQSVLFKFDLSAGVSDSSIDLMLGTRVIVRGKELLGRIWRRLKRIGANR